MERDRKNSKLRKWYILSVILFFVISFGGGMILGILSGLESNNYDIGFVDLEFEQVPSTTYNEHYTLTVFCSSESVMSDGLIVEVKIKMTDGYFSINKNLQFGAKYSSSWQKVSTGIYKATYKMNDFWYDTNNVSYTIISKNYYEQGDISNTYTLQTYNSQELSTKVSELAQRGPQISIASIFGSIYSILVPVLFINVFISALACSKKNLTKRYSLNNVNQEEFSSDINTSNTDCNNTCVEEGDDIFAEKREEGKIAFRTVKKKNNASRSNGKKYCRHCGAEMLYDDDRCDWCGEDQ